MNRSGSLRLECNRGFTLMEVLVAFMVMAIAMVVVMQLFSGGLKSAALSSDYMHGIFHAQQKMEELLVEDPIIAGSRSGQFEDGYKWEAQIEHRMLETDFGHRLPVDAYHISLKVTWQRGGRSRDFEIKTLTLGPPMDEESRVGG